MSRSTRRCSSNSNMAFCMKLQLQSMSMLTFECRESMCLQHHFQSPCRLPCLQTIPEIRQRITYSQKLPQFEFENPKSTDRLCWLLSYCRNICKLGESIEQENSQMISRYLSKLLMNLCMQQIRRFQKKKYVYFREKKQFNKKKLNQFGNRFKFEFNIITARTHPTKR